MIAKVSGETVLDKILVPDKPISLIVDDIHEYLKRLSEEMRHNELPLENFVINKALTKRPEEYHDTKLTHVAVALRYNQKNLGKHLRAGDTVSFVICLDGTKNPATQRGYHIEEVRQTQTAVTESNLKVDIEYYLSQQLLPVVSRLVDPIDGTDPAIIAEMLGVEVKRSMITHHVQVQLELDPALNSGDHKYDICKALMICCPKCHESIEIRHLFTRLNKHSKDLIKLDPKDLSLDQSLFKLTLSGCDHCGTQFPSPPPANLCFYFELQLIKQIQNLINTFYVKELHCDDHACCNRTRYLTGPMNGSWTIACSKCKNGGMQLEVINK